MTVEQIEIENKFLIIETELDKLLRGSNNSAIISKVYELSSLVKESPFLYERFIKKIVSIPKKYRTLSNPFLQDIGSESVSSWLIENNKNLFEFLEVKSFKLSKFKEFETRYLDNTFMNIHVKYVGKDFLRPIFLSTNFNESGVVSTNCNVLLFTKYRSEHREDFDKYCYSKLSFDNEEQILSKKYPNWQQVIPTKFEKVVSFDSIKFFNFLKNAKECLLFNSNTRSLCLEIDSDTCLFVNSDYLIDTIDTMSKLGYNDLEIVYSGVNRAILIVPKDSSNSIVDFKEDFVLMMPLMFLLNKEVFDPIYNLQDSSARFSNEGKKYFF